MQIALESTENFNRGIADDSFLGIVAFPKKETPINYSTGVIYLALAQRRDATVIPAGRFSTLKGVEMQPLPGGGGHAIMARAAGVIATQIAQGVAEGSAMGFSIIKTGDAAMRIATYRSGFNRQYPGKRPALAPVGTINHDRTLPLDAILVLRATLNKFFTLEADATLY